jgi:hypothetical protein
MMQINHVTDAVISRLVAAIASANTAPPVLVPAAIPAGESLSGVVTVPKGMRLWALALPAEWTESEISYQISFNGQQFYEAVDAVGAIETPRGLAGTAFLVCSYGLLRAAWVRIRSGSAQTPLAQQAYRTLQLLFLPHNSPTIF